MNLDFGNKKEEKWLKPLSEKEIQAKLYGNYQEGRVQEKSEPEWSERAEPSPAPKKTPTLVERPKLPRLNLPRVNFPWQKIASILFEVAQTVGGGLLRAGKAVFSRLLTGWGVSFLVVVFLFLGINALNSYRTHAMKTSKGRKISPQSVVVPAGPLDRNHKPLSRPAEPVKAAAPISPPAAKLVNEAGIKKPYVIQVATYAQPQDAERLTRQMTEANLSAFHQTLTGRNNGKTFYAVFLGRFETFSEAQAEQKKFTQTSFSKDFPDSFIRSLN